MICEDDAYTKAIAQKILRPRLAEYHLLVRRKENMTSSNALSIMLFAPSFIAVIVLAITARAHQIVSRGAPESSSSKPIDLERIYQAYPDSNLNLTELRLIRYDASAPPVSVTQLEKFELRARGINFFDITDAPNLEPRAYRRQLSSSSYPSPSATAQVESVIAALSTDPMKVNLEAFTNHTTRLFLTRTGRQSQQWLLSKINEITSSFAHASLQDRFNISEFPHEWPQQSIITRIHGMSPEEGTIVIAAHQDSLNNCLDKPAPGADDDGSGVVSVLEAYRGLISSGFTPKRNVEFHFYAAEEGGLLGSQAIARDYASRDENVLAVLSFDMTAFVKRGTNASVGLLTDFTDNGLTTFTKALVDEYLDIPYVETQCGYACSDHASWTEAGYPSNLATEGKFEDTNPNIHSENDRIDISDEFSFDHMLHFAKLAAAFAIELGQWE